MKQVTVGLPIIICCGHAAGAQIAIQPLSSCNWTGNNTVCYGGPVVDESNFCGVGSGSEGYDVAIGRASTIRGISSYVISGVFLQVVHY